MLGTLCLLFTLVFYIIYVWISLLVTSVYGDQQDLY